MARPQLKCLGAVPPVPPKSPPVTGDMV